MSDTTARTTMMTGNPGPFTSGGPEATTDGPKGGTGRRAPQPKRKHPSHGARVVAVLSSVAATVGVGAALANADSAASGAGTAAASATSAAPATSATSASTSATSATASSPSSSSSGSSTAIASPAASSTGTSAASSAKYADGTYTGASEWTRWGNYQVQVSIRNGKIVSVQETQSPSDGRSMAINGRAQPVLESEAIAAQTAKINAVSGATYTSATYKSSLQSALDQAVMAAQAGQAAASA